VWAGRGEKGGNGDFIKMGQLTLSMGSARAKVRSYIHLTIIPSKRVIPYIKYL
jgi:hypothetical protein